jgi:thiamine-monophosphate kinase
LAEGAWLARRTEVRAMMDVSDGLAKDLDSLTTSGLTAALAEPAIPISTAARQAAIKSGRSPLAHALGDGEDYELLIVVQGRADPSELARDWKRRFPAVPLTRIGSFVSGKRLPVGALDLSLHRGYEHLR